MKLLAAELASSQGLLEVLLSQVPVRFAVFHFSSARFAVNVRSSTASQSSSPLSLKSFQRNVIVCPGAQANPPTVALIMLRFAAAFPSRLLTVPDPFGATKFSDALPLKLPVRISVALVL